MANVIQKATLSGPFLDHSDGGSGVMTSGGGYYYTTDSNTVSLYRSPDLDNWTAISTFSKSVTFYAYGMAYGSGTLIVSGFGTSAGGTEYFYSKDNGATLISGTLPTSAIWRECTFVNGMFVITGANIGTPQPCYYAISADGVNWTLVNLPALTNNNWRIPSYNGTDLYVGLCDTGLSITSTNLTTWTQNTITGLTDVPSFYNSSCYGAGKFFALWSTDTSNVSGYSTDGIAWTTVDLVTYSPIICTPSPDGKQILITNNTGFQVSDNPANWNNTIQSQFNEQLLQMFWTSNDFAVGSTYSQDIYVYYPVSFTSSATSGNAPLTVTFTDTSDGSPTAWSWDFGDGGTSTLESPTHAYASQGTYLATLTVTKDGTQYASNDGSSVVAADTINVVQLHSSFTASATSFTGTPASVTFTDTSPSETGGLTYLWNFGDGGTSTQQNPTHVYATPGTFTVTFTPEGYTPSTTVISVSYSYTLKPSDANVFTRVTDSYPVTYISIQNDTDQPGWSIGSRFWISNEHSGSVVIQPEAGVTINSSIPLELDVYGTTYILTRIGYNTWNLGSFGDTQSPFPKDILVHGLTVGLGDDTDPTNTALGVNVLGNNSYASTQGSYSVGVGYGALAYSTTAIDNTAVGYQALNGSTTGSDNTAVGQWSLYANVTGYQNTASGSYSLYSLVTGTDNTSTGFDSLGSLTSGAQNTASGSEAGYSGTAFADNVLVGYQAGYGLTVGSENVVIGSSAMTTAIAVNGVVSIGYQSLNAVDSEDNAGSGSNATQAGDDFPVAVGYKALGQWLWPLHPTAYATAVGGGALSNSTGTSFIVAVGSLSGSGIDVGRNNVFVGDHTQQTGDINYSVGIGSYALENNTGDANTAVGYQALIENTTGGTFNVVVGYQAGALGQTLGLKEGIKFGSGIPGGIGGYNTWVGANSGQKYNQALSNTTCIGSNALATNSNQVVLGDQNVTETLINGGKYAQVNASSTPESVASVVSGAPYTNTLGYDIDILVYGSPATSISWARNGGTYYLTGMTTGFVRLSPNDSINVVFGGGTTFIIIPR